LQIVKTQSLIRGWLERRKFKAFAYEMTLSMGQYFKKEELMETITPGNKYDPNGPVVINEIKYQCTGSLYKGEMQGGFRHG